MSGSSLARADMRHHQHGMHAHQHYQHYHAGAQPLAYHAGRHYTGQSPPLPLVPHSPSGTEQHSSMSPLARAVAGDKRGKGGDDEALAETGEEAARILEDRRRRNASASARFRRRRNERERELVSRCMFLEQRLAEALSPRAFEDIMKKAPVSAAALEGARRPVSLASDHEDDAVSAWAASPPPPPPISVCALTAPRTIDDVWAAYLALSQQVADSLQRIACLETKTKS
ncbi:hypothetical protein GGI20_002112 [Coemansia sp. BCRC 34301]|nr:hypothetical protein GGI20_002112 [Coemansia sp. BCRC 34301]